jgi:hypothetical protein
MVYVSPNGDDLFTLFLEDTMTVYNYTDNREGIEAGMTATSGNESGNATASEAQSPALERSDLGKPGASEGSESLPAQRATGPRTPEGKQRSRLNSLKHRIFSKVVVIKGEPQAEFDALLNGLRNCYQPVGTFEATWVDKLASLIWCQRRVIIAQGKANIGNARDTFGLIEPPDWDLLLRYYTTLDRAIDRTLAQLERFQRMRLGQPVPPRIDVNLSSS